jgi:hypothetical protein
MTHNNGFMHHHYISMIARAVMMTPTTGGLRIFEEVVVVYKLATELPCNPTSLSLIQLHSINHQSF